MASGRGGPPATWQMWTSFDRQPEREVAPGRETLSQQKRVVCPCEPRIARRHRPASFQERTHRQRSQRTAGVENACAAGLQLGDQPSGEVSRVEQLYRMRRIARSKNFTADSDALYPIPEAAGRVVWAGQHARPDDESPVTEGCHDRPLAPDLERPVGFGPPSDLGVVYGRVRRGVFIGAARRNRGVHAARRDKAVPTGPRAQCRRGGGRLFGHVRRRVHNRVPSAGIEGAQICIPVAVQRFDFREEVRIGATTGEGRHSVAALKRGRYDMSAEEQRAAEHQDLHT